MENADAARRLLSAIGFTPEAAKRSRYEFMWDFYDECHVDKHTLPPLPPRIAELVSPEGTCNVKLEAHMGYQFAHAYLAWYDPDHGTKGKVITTPSPNLALRFKDDKAAIAAFHMISATCEIDPDSGTPNQPLMRFSGRINWNKDTPRMGTVH